ncbi:MAG: nucleoside deaminase [Deltaproteobacteria bacterium]|nr:nucleoside deaminase [Deltaproteobacteria bacterium]
MNDFEYMRLALAEAEKAAAAGDVPVGAIVVLEGRVIAVGWNRREEQGDPTAHAEVEALRAASRQVGGWRVEGILYVTQEPCPMCAGALVNARIKRLVFGCDNPKAGAVKTLYTIPTDVRLNHRMEVTGGILAEECAALLRSFFVSLRAEP